MSSVYKNDFAEENFPVKYRKDYDFASECLMQLREKGILRNVPSDYFEWLICKVLDLKLSKSTNQKGWDAISSSSNEKFQIKARAEKSERTAFHFKKFDKGDFHYFLGILCSKDDHTLQGLKMVIKVPFMDVKKFSVKNKGGYRFRINADIIKKLEKRNYILFRK